MHPEIRMLSEKKLIGKNIRMTLAENKTVELWKRFMPRRKEIKNNLNADLISMQVFDSSFEMKDFNQHTTIDKWAAVEVSDFNFIPEGMNTFTIRAGHYAVFLHRGPASAGVKTFQYIFTTWLPDSGYELDSRPHFEILGDRYKNEDPESEEEVFIPIRRKF
jgi:AraC family transcriptional regulator